MSYLSTMYSPGGESRDISVEVPTEDIATSGGVSVVTTAGRVVDGSRAILFNTDTNAQKAVVMGLTGGLASTSSVNQIIAVMGHVGLSGALTNAVRVFGPNVADGFSGIAINTSLQLYLTNGTVDIGHPSLDLISTSGMTSFCVVYDFSVDAVNSGDAAWITMYVDGRYQWDGLCSGAGSGILGVGSTQVWGDWYTTASNRGADLYGDSLCCIVGNERSTDLPSIFALPRLKVLGSGLFTFTGNGSHVAWTTGTGTFDYAELDDSGAGANDGDTTYVSTVINSAKETYWWAAANPITSADTVFSVYQQDVSKAASAGKVTFAPLYRDTLANEATGTTYGAGTNYVGQRRNMTALRPAGGSWVYTDFDLFSGTSTGATTGPPGTMTDTGAVGWDTNIFAGAVVTSGGKTLTVASNTTTVITGTGGWSGGGNPGAAAYTIAASKLQVGGIAPAAGTVGVRNTSMMGPEVICYSATWDMAPGWV